MYFRACMLAAALVANSSAVFAALYEYDFSGIISDRPAGTTIAQGDPFSGRWLVETAQPGVPISPPSSGQEGLQYDLKRLTISLAGTTYDLQNSGGVYVSETELRPGFEQFWPSGFSADYVVTSFAVPDFPLAGTEAWRFTLAFSYDGADVWDDFGLPGEYAFLQDAVFAGMVISTSGTGPGSGVNIIGNFTSVAASVVPLPGSLLFVLSGFGVVVINGTTRSRGKSRCAA